MIEFTKSVNNEIDSNKYGFEDIMLEEDLNSLTFNKRIEIANSWLNDLEYRGLSLKRRILETGSREIVKILDNNSNKVKEYINLGSNDYLNLTHHPEITKAVQESIDFFGCGAGSTPHAIGTSRLHAELENKIAELKGCEAAIVQSSGFSANYGVINALMKKNDIVIFDQFVHASLQEGANSCETNKIYFKHNDLNSLEYILKKAKKEYLNRLVVVDGIYSMDGDIAPLDEILMLVKKYDSWLLVDDAHATGTIGTKGKGTIEYFNLEGQIDIVTGTFSKALGSVGGFIAGKNKFINYLLLSNKSYVFSTSAFTPAIAASLKAIEIIEKEPSLLKKLNQNTTIIKDGLIELGYDVGNTISPIIPVMIGDENEAQEIGKKLQEFGIVSLVVIFPAVPKKQARIRLSVTSGLTIDQIKYILSVFGTLKKSV